MTAPVQAAQSATPTAFAHGAHEPQPLSSCRGAPLRGRLRPPGDKSISHRALMLGLLSVGTTRITGLLEGEDVLRTAAACRQLGATISRHGETWTVNGMGVGSLLAPRDTLDFGNAGTGARLMLGICGGHAIEAAFDGDASLRKRPMRRILDPLVLMGVEVVAQAEGGRCPLVIRGTAEPTPIEYHTPVASAQIKSAVLLAGLNSPGRTSIVEREASRDHTEKMLSYFGAEVAVEALESGARRITLQGRPELQPRPIAVPGDPSSAAFAMVAATVVPGSDIVVEHVMMNPLRTGLIDTLREMGADIATVATREEGGEIVADLRVRHASLRGVDVPAGRAPSMIDEYPVLAVAAAFAEGETRMSGLAEMRVKESDRLAAVAAGLVANDIENAIIGDDLVVQGSGGRPVRGGGIVATHFDHRIAMSFLCLGLHAEEAVQVDDVAMIATSYPTFTADMAGLGAQFR